MKFKILIILIFLFFLICVPKLSNEQVISFSMRKISSSTNQFGLDLLRASTDKNDNKLVFCPFCISSSLVMLLMGSQGKMANSLKDALYLRSMSENEINLAYFDMMNHLGVNLPPTQKQQPSSIQATTTTNLNFKTPVTGGSSGHFNVDLKNKYNLLSSESQTLTLIPNNYINSLQSSNSLNFSQRPTDLSFKNQNFDATFYNKIQTNTNQIFQPYDFIDRNKLKHPFSPYNENVHRNNFIKFSTNQLINSNLNRFPPLNSDINMDVKTLNYLFGRSMKRENRAFGFKNNFWNSKSYLNPFGTMLNAFQNNFQNGFQHAPNYPSNYHQNIVVQPSDMAFEKFGQNINHQALNNIKGPNNFHYYNKHMSSKPNFNNQVDNHRNITTKSSNFNNKEQQTTVNSSITSTTTSTATATTKIPTELPKNYSTKVFNHYHHYPHHYNYNTLIKEHKPNLDDLLINFHSIRLGNSNFDLMNHNHQDDSRSGNDIYFLNNIYVQRDFVINYHYHVLLQKFYKTAIHPLDFIHNGEETRQHINSIIQMQTDNKICDILPERQSPSTQLLLVSALYFKGELDLKLNVTRTKWANSISNDYQINQNMNTNQTNGIFYHQHNFTIKNKEFLNKGNQLNLDNDQSSDEIWMEASRTRLRYSFDKYLNCSTVEMPFKDSMITLVIMIPNDKDGLETLLTKLNAQILHDVINSLEIKRITIKIPKINIENSFRNLSMALANLGLSDLFRPGQAQLTNISDFKWLYVSDLIHKTHLNIKESSIHNQEIISSKPRTKQDDNQSDVINIELNKPFLFFIIDSVSGLIMSMGKMEKKFRDK